MPVQSDLFYFGLNNGPNAVAQFSKTEYRSARITIQASSNVEHQLSEVYLIHDNNLVYIRQLNFIYTTDPFVSYTAVIDSNNVYLQANSSLANTDLVIFANLFDNPITAADKTIDFEKIVGAATAVSAMYPDETTDYAAAMTSSLDKEEDLIVLRRDIDNAIEYMQTAAFKARPTAEKSTYIENLANTINNMGATLDEVVQADTQAYYDANKKLESASILTGLNLGMTNQNVKVLMNKVLNDEGKSLFNQ